MAKCFSVSTIILINFFNKIIIYLKTPCNQLNEARGSIGIGLIFITVEAQLSGQGWPLKVVHHKLAKPLIEILLF